MHQARKLRSKQMMTQIQNSFQTERQAETAFRRMTCNSFQMSPTAYCLVA